MILIINFQLVWLACWSTPRYLENLFVGSGVGVGAYVQQRVPEQSSSASQIAIKAAVEIHGPQSMIYTADITDKNIAI